MIKTTRRGATVEEAISAALATLGVTQEQVKVEVIDKGKKGFLGFGAKEAEVTVTVIRVDEPSVKEKIATPTKVESKEVAKDSKSEVIINEPHVKDKEERKDELSDEKAIEETEKYLKTVASDMGISDLKVNYVNDGKYVTFQLNSEKAAMLIGKRGQTLNALQQLSQLVANQYASQFKVIRVDVGDYRERREQSLEQLANRMADKAVRSGRKVQLEPMPSYERKVIHNALSNRLDIETYSEGTDPYRYLVIEPIR